MAEISDNGFVGQYIGAFVNSDESIGYVKLNADPDRNGVGVAYISNNAGNFYVLNFKANSTAENFIYGTAVRSEYLERFYDSSRTLSEAERSEIKFKIEQREDGDTLTVVENGKEFAVNLHPIRQGRRVVASRLETWQAFKEWAQNIKSDDRSAIFRGIGNSGFNLITSFHRTGRVDLERYRDSDISVFKDYAETVGGLRVEGDMGAIWGYAQHHGFPTPLLDWTESPYIAAYFALRDHLQGFNNENMSVKIYYLNGGFVSANAPGTVSMADVFPRAWILRPASKGNQRLVFQQGVFLHSNVVDIESYLLYWSERQNVPVISAIEMPASLAREALDDLSYMGVSSLSLFPGLDGAAQYATFKQFYSRR